MQELSSLGVWSGAMTRCQATKWRRVSASTIQYCASVQGRHPSAWGRGSRPLPRRPAGCFKRRARSQLLSTADRYEDQGYEQMSHEGGTMAALPPLPSGSTTATDPVAPVDASSQRPICSSTTCKTAAGPLYRRSQGGARDEPLPTPAGYAATARLAPSNTLQALVRSPTGSSDRAGGKPAAAEPRHPIEAAAAQSPIRTHRRAL
jgi:hypothetical protein